MPQMPLDRVKSLCDHCGNVSFKHQLYSSDIRVGSFYRLYRCEICENVLLQKVLWITNAMDRDRVRVHKREEIVQLWPLAHSLPSEVPNRISEVYEEARSVRKSPSSFVVQIGRALEVMTRDLKAKGKTLNNRLNFLITQGVIPRVFGEMGHINRIFRNWGAHDAEISVKPEDVQTVDDFFKALIEYVYVAPAKVERVKKRIKTYQSKTRSRGKR